MAGAKLDQRARGDQEQQRRREPYAGRWPASAEAPCGDDQGHAAGELDGSGRDRDRAPQPEREQRGRAETGIHRPDPQDTRQLGRAPAEQHGRQQRNLSLPDLEHCVAKHRQRPIVIVALKSRAMAAQPVTDSVHELLVQSLLTCSTLPTARYGMRTNCGATLPTGSSAHPDPGSRAGYDTPSSPGGSSTGSCQVTEPLIVAGTRPLTIAGAGIWPTG